MEWRSKEMTDVTTGVGRGMYGPSLHYSSRGTVLQNFFFLQADKESYGYCDFNGGLNLMERLDPPLVPTFFKII